MHRAMIHHKLRWHIRTSYTSDWILSPCLYTNQQESFFMKYRIYASKVTECGALSPKVEVSKKVEIIMSFQNGWSHQYEISQKRRWSVVVKKLTFWNAVQWGHKVVDLGHVTNWTRSKRWEIFSASKWLEIIMTFLNC